MVQAESNDNNVKIQRFKFERDSDNQLLVGPDGNYYGTEAEAMYYSMTVGCGCGSPSEVHQLLIDCLKHFDHDRQGSIGVKGIERIVKERPDVVAEFIGHYLNETFLAEHGGSVYGSWVTERGKQFIEVGPL